MDRSAPESAPADGAETERQALPLCVDLDGTLIASDTLLECLARSLRQPLVALQTPIWLLQGRAVLKARLAERIDLDPQLLPYREEVCHFVAQQHAQGRTICLATAANQHIARKVADHLGYFSDVVASSDSVNLKAHNKADELVRRYGEKGFAYVGDSSADEAVWRRAGGAVYAGRPGTLQQSAAGLAPLEAVLVHRGNQLAAAIKALRPHQWVKNLLIFIPLLASGAFADAVGWMHAALAFVAFCAISSLIYLINDLTDLDADRVHPRKRRRPFASGTLSIAVGFVVIPVLLVVGGTAAILAGTWALMIIYAVSSIAYSVRLKELPLVDCFMLAGLYTIRLYTGGYASGHFVSLWLLTFSGFFFLSLAMIKRVSELMAQSALGDETNARRGYYVSDLNVMMMLGVAASFAAAVVLTQYVQSDDVMKVYRRPELVWLMVPLLLFWQGRLWLATARGYMRDDPIVYAARDWVSGLVFLSVLLVVWAAHSGVAGLLQ